jgi:hypothetical protein
MPDDAIRHVFNDRTANMSITVLNLTEASALLRTINRRDIKADCGGKTHHKGLVLGRRPKA